MAGGLARVLVGCRGRLARGPWGPVLRSSALPAAAWPARGVLFVVLGLEILRHGWVGSGCSEGGCPLPHVSWVLAGLALGASSAWPALARPGGTLRPRVVLPCVGLPGLGALASCRYSDHLVNKRIRRGSFWTAGVSPAGPRRPLNFPAFWRGACSCWPRPVGVPSLACPRPSRWDVASPCGLALCGPARVGGTCLLSVFRPSRQ